MMTPVLIVGAISGVAWWAVSMMLGAGSYGIVGTYPAAGAIAGLVTGVAIAALSRPVYQLPSWNLLWYSPLSVYVAIAIYGALVFLFRLVSHDFQPGQIPWAVGVQSVLGMGWGVTMLTLVAIPVHLLAYGNHRILARIVRGSTRPKGYLESHAPRL